MKKSIRILLFALIVTASAAPAVYRYCCGGPICPGAPQCPVLPPTK